MNYKTKKRIICLAAVLSYALGMLFSPAIADESASFDALLSQRENYSKPQQQPYVSSDLLHTHKKAEISDFTDVNPDDWFYSYLDYLVSNELIKGKTPSAFEPQSTFSYAECSTVITRYLGLENVAKQRKAELYAMGAECAEIWYSGYFQVMYELGILSDYDLFEADGSYITYIDTELSESPVSRYRFAESISASFELDGALRARNVPSEIGGRGHEFILGTFYNEDILYEYEYCISDFEDIPKSSRTAILKAYYNGIFNGDVSGCFYPNADLTRAEMAKVLATVTDLSMRTRLIDEGYAPDVSSDMLFNHSLYEGMLTFEAATEILENEAEYLDCDGGEIEYSRSFDIPLGYAIDVYIYEDNGGGLYEMTYECSLRDGNPLGFEYQSDNARILMVLRNTVQGLRTEGVLDIKIQDGEISEVSSTERPM